MQSIDTRYWPYSNPSKVREIITHMPRTLNVIEHFFPENLLENIGDLTLTEIMDERCLEDHLFFQQDDAAAPFYTKGESF